MTYELPLYKDQIHSDAWIELCDYAFDEIVEPWVFDKAAKSDLQLFDSENGIGKSGVIYCGTNQNIYACLRSISKDGNYILITRDNDRSITEEIYRLKPASIKHWFAINCAVKHEDITAIPYGIGGISGYSKTLELVAENNERQNGGKFIYCRINVPSVMEYPHERHICLDALESNPLATVIWQPLDGERNFKNILNYPFVAAPAGTGADTMRSLEAISLGAIPILSDMPELRNAYEGMPVMFTKDWVIDKDYLEIIMRLKYTSTRKARMSYWIEQVKIKKQQYGIGLDNRQ